MIGSQKGVSAIVLAAGRGQRFGGYKQFTAVGGKRLVDCAVEAVAGFSEQIILVLPAGIAWDGPPVSVLVSGGETRAQSVRNGLALVHPHADVVLIHDPAHPLASANLVESVIAAVREGADAALPVLPLNEPLKQIEGNRIVRTLDRVNLVFGQTPHGFRANALRLAHAGNPEALEDTMLIEAQGGQVTFVPGDPRNIHVTTPEELAMVQAMVRQPAL